MRAHPGAVAVAVVVIGVGVCTAAGACRTGGYHSKPRVAVVAGDPVVAMARPGDLPSLDHPSYVPYRQHSDPPFRDERVVGVSLGEPRMYPIGLLDHYEVINDEAGGVPYAVVRCALTDFAGVLDRRVAGRTLTFENSGALWRDMLVLQDRQTHTYWSPATGLGLSGPLEGERLTLLPAAVVTTADAWEELDPETVCLETGEMSSVSFQLRLYAKSSWEGLSGDHTADRRFPPKARVFVVAEGPDAVAFSGEQLRKRKSVALRLGERPFVLEWDTGTRSPRAYRTESAGSAREERPVIPLYWFAALRHFPGVRTLAELTPRS